MSAEYYRRNLLIVLSSSVESFNWETQASTGGSNGTRALDVKAYNATSLQPVLREVVFRFTPELKHLLPPASSLIVVAIVRNVPCNDKAWSSGRSAR